MSRRVRARRPIPGAGGPLRLSAGVPVVLVLVLLPAPSLADGLELSLAATREDTEFRYDDGPPRDTRITRVAATFYETSRPGFQPGLTAGAAWLRQDGEPDTEGLDLDGVFAGVLLRSRIPVAAGVSVIGRGSWIWHDVDSDDDGITTSLEWAELEGRAGLALDAGDWQLSGGALARSVDGDLQVEGERTVPFDGGENTGGWARLAIGLAGGGELVFEAEAGARERLGVSVQRRF